MYTWSSVTKTLLSRIAQSQTHVFMRSGIASTAQPQYHVNMYRRRFVWTRTFIGCQPSIILVSRQKSPKNGKPDTGQRELMSVCTVQSIALQLTPWERIRQETCSLYKRSAYTSCQPLHRRPRRTSLTF